MKKIRKVLLALVLMFLPMFLISCGAKGTENADGGVAPGASSGFVNSDTTRKIIYEADIEMKSKSPSETYKQIKAFMPEDSWSESEKIVDEKYVLVIRIKYTEFDKFIENISSLGDVSSCSKTSKDITAIYEQLLNRKEAYEAEHARLLELMKTASTSDITLYITPRLTEIEAELADINDSLTKYDDKVNYSTINIYLNEKKESSENFGSSVLGSLKSGWKGFVSVICFIIRVIVFLLPFIVLVAIILGGYYFYNKYHKNKLNKKNTNVEDGLEENDIIEENNKEDKKE